jgi:hypothetical protein
MIILQCRVKAKPVDLLGSRSILNFEALPYRAEPQLRKLLRRNIFIKQKFEG